MHNDRNVSVYGSGSILKMFSQFSSVLAVNLFTIFFEYGGDVGTVCPLQDFQAHNFVLPLNDKDGAKVSHVKIS